MKTTLSKMICVLSLSVGYGYAATNEAPSNAELYEMLKATQQQLSEAKENVVGANGEYSFKVLDHAETTNTKQLYQLQAIRDGMLQSKLTLGGQITALVNYQKANENTKFGWLMRHPTSANQIGETSSEAVIHSSNLNVTAKLADGFTGYVELLYNPEQNFASGSTITGLPRNNVNVRRAYILWGDLAKSSVYASLGKMDIPFGLNNTVSPFTNSTNWHSFAGLAYGGLVGYSKENMHLRFMAIQGGAQFRNANAPVEGTNVPSLVNNYALDANIDIAMSGDATLNIGASYQYGSSYCQGYVDDPSTHVVPGPGAPPINTVAQGVKHFNACEDNNDSIAVYSTYSNDGLMLLAEYAETLKVWPGTFNPYIPEFAAAKNKTFTVGARQSADVGLANNVDFSIEFSRFNAGPSGSPWEKQDQLVLGASYYVAPNVNLFAEAVRVEGWVPLNFLSGGNPGSVVGASWSSQTSTTNVFTLGIQAAF
ncbi:hypothetical protein N9L91_01490 [Pseudomonadales bacterium]|nr:hypothetical protein [Pseudomonadales bacterium]